MSRAFARLVQCLAAQGAQPREELDTRRVRICPRCREDWLRCEHKGHVLLAAPPTERGWLVKSRDKVLA